MRGRVDVALAREDVLVVIPLQRILNVDETRSRVSGNQISSEECAQSQRVGAIPLLLFLAHLEYFEPSFVIQDPVSIVIESLKVRCLVTEGPALGIRYLRQTRKNVPAFLQHRRSGTRCISAKGVENSLRIQVQGAEAGRKESGADRACIGSGQ